MTRRNRRGLMEGAPARAGFVGKVFYERCAMERVFFVCKKVERQRGRRVATYAVGEVGQTLPKGYHEVQRTRTLHMAKAIAESKRLQKGR